jgi:hypothetical protein
MGVRFTIEELWDALTEDEQRRVTRVYHYQQLCDTNTTLTTQLYDLIHNLLAE